jgi:putative N-acetyltransferase (TIGR04045 family)
MLDRIHPWGKPLRAQTAQRITAEIAREAWQIAAYFRLRSEIFAAEQGLFEGSDRDEHDAHASAIVAQGEIAGMPDAVVGVVRIYRAPNEGEDNWFGGRLGVAHAYRRVGAVGTALITEAVSTAHAWGCRRFLATVQDANLRYFEHHHFRRLEAVQILGRPHVLMQADLERYPARLSSTWRASTTPADWAGADRDRQEWSGAAARQTKTGETSASFVAMGQRRSASAEAGSATRRGADSR